MVESSAPVGDVWTAVRGAAVRAGALLTSVTSPVAPPALVRASLVEAVWLAARLWMYPWGFTQEHLRTTGSYASYRTDGLSLAQRGLIVSDVRTAATPILLVHGIGDNRSVFAVLARALRRRGYGVVHAVNISVLTVLTGDVRSAAAELGRHVDRLREQTGSDSVHIIGHSLGGLIARYFVQRLGGDAAVDTLITLGSPHRGSMLAHLLPGTPLVRQLRPGSDLLAELDEPAPGCQTRFLAVWSHLDPVIVPHDAARIPHPDLAIEHLELDYVGHMSMVIDPRTTRAVTARLGQLDRTSGLPDVVPRHEAPRADNAGATTSPGP
jgi:triacylglycerol lipase